MLPPFFEMEENRMKHFANCNPDEFMTQVVKFRAPFVAWVEKIGIPEIRARRPEGYDDMTAEEKAKAINRMANENMGEILAAAMEKDMEGTRELMCLATFTEPKDFNKHTMVEYISAILAMLASEEVRGFFTFYLAPVLKNSTAE